MFITLPKGTVNSYTISTILNYGFGIKKIYFRKLHLILCKFNSHLASEYCTYFSCYNIQLSFRLNRPLKNPYVEAFLQLGTNIPCESEASRGVSNFCTNITQSNWCPQSTNEQLRRLLNGKKTW